MVTNCNTGNFILNEEKPFSLQEYTGTICLERLRSIHPYDSQNPAGHGSEKPTVVNTALSRGSN